VKVETTAARKRIRIGALALALMLCVAGAAAASSPKAGGTGRNLYRLTIDIDAPPDFLFPYLVEEDLISRWQDDGGVVVTFPKGRETRLGKQIRVAVNAPTDPWMLMEIVCLDRPREVRTVFVDGVLRGDFAYLLRPRVGGVTLVHEMRIKPVGFLTTVIWELVGKHLHRAKMKNFMANIKEVVEGDYRMSR
jgi:uncharacterized protein YndB with AHSA1/START domain